MKFRHHHINMWTCNFRQIVWPLIKLRLDHNSDVIMNAKASQSTGVWIVCSTVCSDADQRKHQSSALLAFVRGIHRWSVDSPHKGPVTRKMFPFHDVVILPILRKFRYFICFARKFALGMACTRFLCRFLSDFCARSGFYSKSKHCALLALTTGPSPKPIWERSIIRE